MRDSSTYRSERRNEWRGYNAAGTRGGSSKAAWREFNQPPSSERDLYGSPRAYAHSTVLGRSKYRPHQGKHEMERRRKQLARATQ